MRSIVKIIEGILWIGCGFLLLPSIVVILNAIFNLSDFFDYNIECLDKFEILILSLVVIYINYIHYSLMSKENVIDDEKRMASLVVEKNKEETDKRLYEINKKNELYDKKIKECDSLFQQMVDVIKEDFPFELKSRSYDTLGVFGKFLQGWNHYKKQYRIRDEKLRELLENAFPFNKVASLCADAETMIFKEEYKNLVSKSHPAYTAAETVKKLRKEAKAYIEAYKIMLYKYDYLLCQFPELEKYVDDYEAIKATCDTTTLKEAEYLYDKTKDWISDDEYKLLNEDERNQLALDKYINSNNKSKWKIGRDYELYIGYKFRSEGWKVTQFGVERRLEDLGRDLIVEKVDNNNILQVRVVQCKMWSKDKQIHENAICQLYGTTIQYIMENKNLFDLERKVLPVFVSTTELSETALRFAKFLNVQVRVVPMAEFPRIKCNISKEGEKIYHLPFDQQYDTAKIDKPGEFYAWTVKEAVDAGFRRAFRYTSYS